MSDIEDQIYREYDLSGTFRHIQDQLLRKYERGEITEEELRRGIENVVKTEATGEELKDHIMKSKAQKMKEVEEKYANDEIGEKELEKQMEQLLESGDEFLDVDLDEQQKAEKRADQKDEAMFRIKEVAQILLYATLVIGFFAAAVVTKGQVLALLVPLVLIGLMLFMAFKR